MISALGPNFLAILILSLLVLLIRRNPILTKERSRAYYILVLAVLFVVFLETFIGVLPLTFDVPYSLFYSLSFFITPIVPLLFAKVIYPSVVTHKNKLIFFPFVIHLIFAISNPFTGLYFSLSESNQIVYGSFFKLFFIFLCYAYCLVYYASYKASRGYEKADRPYFYIPATVSLLCSVLQWLPPFLLLGRSGLAVGMFYYYTFMRELHHRYDPLTGAMNRMAFQTAMEKLQNHNAVTIAVFDLNRLKQINDNYGHSVGDKTISDMAKIIQESFGGIGTVYRIGGDEFCLICEKTKKDLIETAFGRVDELVAKHSDVHDVPFSIAYGYAEFDKKTTGTIYDCFDSADSRMYLNKRFIKGQTQRRKED